VPKVIVMFVGDEAATEAEAIASAAKTVRFTEVDVRASRTSATRHRVLAAQPGVTYDGAVLVSADASGDAAAIELLASCTHEHTVFGGRSRASMSAAERVGGIVVMARAGDADDEGARVAKVAGWVRHALGHEAEHAHGHAGAHSADHSHDHSRSHGHSHSHGHPHEHDHVHEHEHRHTDGHSHGAR
jgi:hypothetical protein